MDRRYKWRGFTTICDVRIGLRLAELLSDGHVAWVGDGSRGGLNEALEL